MIVIGIDPGTTTGFAVYCPSTNRLTVVKSTSFWEAYRSVVAFHPSEVLGVVIEVPDTKHVWQKVAMGTKAIQRQAVNVGGVLREAQLLADGIEKVGYRVKRVNPRKKIDANTFREFTGWQGQTNQHERDAGILCWRRNAATL